jgi:hypothetical protein
MAAGYSIAIDFGMIVAPQVSAGYYVYASEQQKQEYYEAHCRRFIYHMQMSNLPTTTDSSAPSATLDTTKWLISPDSSILNHDGKKLRLPIS